MTDEIKDLKQKLKELMKKRADLEQKKRLQAQIAQEEKLIEGEKPKTSLSKWADNIIQGREE